MSWVGWPACFLYAPQDLRKWVKSRPSGPPTDTQTLLQSSAHGAIWKARLASPSILIAKLPDNQSQKQSHRTLVAQVSNQKLPDLLVTNEARVYMHAHRLSWYTRASGSVASLSNKEDSEPS